MTHEEHTALTNIAINKPWLASLNLKLYLKTVKIEEYPKKTHTKRSGAQNNALHKGFQLIAEALNNAGLDMRAVLKPSVSIPWSTESVKEYLYKPIMKLKTGKESTTELEKTSGEISEIWDIMMRFLGENHHLEYIPFPSNEIYQGAPLHEEV